jgi:indole-3-glycerol phosphate synthase
VNNRHLGSFVTDVQHSFRIAEQLPKDAVLISESGISDVNTILKLRAAGFKGFLIGETFMRTKQPASTLKQFIKDLQQDEKVAR